MPSNGSQAAKAPEDHPCQQDGGYRGQRKELERLYMENFEEGLFRTGHNERVDGGKKSEGNSSSSQPLDNSLHQEVSTRPWQVEDKSRKGAKGLEKMSPGYYQEFLSDKL